MRFSLRGLLLLTTALCLFLGWRTYHETKLRRIDGRLEELQVRRKLVRDEAAVWQRHVWGAAALTRIDRVVLSDEHFQGGALEEIIDLLLSWGGVREIVLEHLMMPLKRDDYEQIARVKSLQRLVYDYCEPHDASAMEPLRQLPNLREISIEISWGKQSPFPFDFYLSLPSLKVLGLPSWSDEEERYVLQRRPDLRLEITDFPP